MSKLLLFLLLTITLSYAQVTVVQDFSIQKGTDLPLIRQYEKPEWNNEQEFAIYGWIRINEWVFNEVQIYRFSSNRDINSNTSGDRVLKAFAQDNAITFETYDAKNYDPKVQHTRIALNNFKEWVYIYQAYSPISQRTFGYIKTSTNEYSNYSHTLCEHKVSSFYQLIIGAGPITNTDRVDIKILTVTAGPGAYRETGFDISDVPQVVSPTHKCATIFEECNYKGSYSEFCSSVPSLVIPKFKSVFVPEGDHNIIFYNLENFNGKSVKFLKSVPCIDTLEYSLLVFQGYIEEIDNNDTENKSVKKDTLANRLKRNN